MPVAGQSMERRMFPATILTCSVDQPPPAPNGAQRCRPRTQQAPDRRDPVSRSTQRECSAAFSAAIGPCLILYTGAMLRFPSPIFLLYTCDGGQISLSRKEAFAKRALVQEKILISYQHVLFRGPTFERIRKYHPESQRRAADRDGCDAHHEALHGHARR
jgi:hypothetical protein